MRNAGLDEKQAGIKTARRNINNLSDDSPQTELGTASSVCSHNILYLQLLLHLSSVETVDTLGAFPGLATECLVHHCVTSI